METQCNFKILIENLFVKPKQISDKLVMI